MANILFDKGRDKFATKALSWTADTIKAVLCSSTYVPNLATDEFLSIVTGVLSTSAAFSGKSTLAGACFCNPVVFNGVAAGAIGTQIVFFKDTGVAATSPLIGYLNVGVGFPVTSDGGAITWNPAGNEVFEL